MESEKVKLATGLYKEKTLIFLDIVFAVWYYNLRWLEKIFMINQAFNKDCTLRTEYRKEEKEEGICLAHMRDILEATTHSRRAEEFKEATEF